MEPVAVHVTITDVRKAGFCARGARTWFTKRGFDFKAFLSNGLPAETLLSTGDAFAAIVVDVARVRTEAESGR